MVRNFKETEALYMDDAVARSNYERIAKHLIVEFDEPDLKEEEDKMDMLWKWRTPFVDLTLYLFEQHALKLHFKIERTA